MRRWEQLRGVFIVGFLAASSLHGQSAMRGKEAELTQSQVVGIFRQFGGAAGPIGIVDDSLFVAAGANIVKLNRRSDGSLAYRQTTDIVSDIITGMVAMSRNVVAATAGNAGLFLIEMPDDGPSRLVARLELDGSAEEIARQDEIIFVAAGEYVYVLDVQVPASPKEINRLEILHTMKSDDNMVLNDGLLAIATQVAGLIVYDVRDPIRPILVAFVEELDAVAVSVRGGRVCVFVRHTPKSPEDNKPPWYLRCYLAAGNAFELMMEDQVFDEPIVEMTQDQSRLIIRLVDRIGILEMSNGRFDLSQSRWVSIEPEADLVGTRNAWFRPQRMLLQGDTLLISYSSGGRVDEDVTPHSGVMSINLATPSGTTPTPLWRREGPGDSVLVKRDPSSDALYLLDSGSMWIKICQIDADGNMGIVDEVSSGDQIVTFDAADGMLAILDISSRIAIYRVESAKKPRLMGQRVISGASLVAIWGRRVIVAVSGQSEGGPSERELFVFGVSDEGLTLDPKRVVVCSNEVRAISVVANTMLVACRQAGLVRLMLSPAGELAVRDVVLTPAQALDVLASEDLAVVLTRFPTPADEIDMRPLPVYGGIRVFSNSESAQLEERGAYVTRLREGGGVNKEWSLAVSGKYVVMLAAEDVVRVLDVADPRTPRQIALVEVPGVATSAVFYEDMVYVTCRDGGVLAIGPIDGHGAREWSIFLPSLRRRR